MGNVFHVLIVSIIKFNYKAKVYDVYQLVMYVVLVVNFQVFILLLLLLLFITIIVFYSSLTLISTFQEASHLQVVSSSPFGVVFLWYL